MISFNVTLTGTETLTTKQVNDAFKAAFHAVGVRWRRRYLPKHFTHEGARLYKYTPRKGQTGSGRPFKGSYSQKKLKSVGHTRPLELSGEGKRQALYKPNAVQATRFKVVVRLPRVYNLRAKGSQVQMADEIRAITAVELQALSRFFLQQVERELARRGAPGAQVRYHGALGAAA